MKTLVFSILVHQTSLVSGKLSERIMCSLKITCKMCG